MSAIKDFMWDEAETLISDTYKKVSEGEITLDDVQYMFADELTYEQKQCLAMIGIEDEIDFREAVINES